MKRILSMIPVVANPHPVMACPFCSNTAVIPTSVRCNPTGALRGQVLIERDGILWNPKMEPDAHGVRIELIFRCAAGHSFGTAFHFDQGCTKVERVLDPTDPPTDIIWRD